jgi:hypothetical protein
VYEHELSDRGSENFELPRCICRYELMRRVPSVQGDRLNMTARAGTVLALAIQYSRRHVRKELLSVRGESFHVLESSQVLIPLVVVLV